MARFATRAETEAAAKGWETPVLECRTLGHSWRQANAIHVRRLRYWQVTYRCDRGCNVIRYQEWDEQGRVYASWLRYPKKEDGSEAYLAEGIGRVVGEAKSALRIESVTRNGFTEQTGRAKEEDMPRSSVARISVSERVRKAPA